MNTSHVHEGDFVGWTERQACILKAVPPGTFGLDRENLAKEIAEWVRSDPGDVQPSAATPRASDQAGASAGFSAGPARLHGIEPRAGQTINQVLIPIV